MNSVVKQRLIQFIKYKGLSQKRFEISVGLSNGYVNNIRRSITDDKLQKIARCYPELNKSWLLTGEGEMLLPKEGNVATVEGDGTAVAGNSNQVNATATLDKALDEIAEQRKLTEKAIDEIARMHEQFGEAQEQISRLITLLEKQHQ